MIILGVESGSPANEAGLQMGDLILEMNHKKLNTTREFKREASEIRKDEGVLLLISRQGRRIFFVLKP